MFEKKTESDEQHDATHSEHAAEGHDDHGDDHHGHAVPMTTLVGVFVALMVLTFLTVAATWIELGEFNVWLALLIAFVKAVYVALYFMHLRWDSPFNGLVLAASLAFVVLFIGITLMDSQQYQPVIRELILNPPRTPGQ